MTKKGFTLVELLVVIALIGLLIAIAVPAGLKVSTKIKEKMLDTKIETIEQGAVVWGQNNRGLLSSSKNTCNIDGTNYKCIEKDINTLLNEKILSEDKEETKSDGTKNKILINPVTNKSINYCNVYIYLKNNRVYAKYDTDTGNCYQSYSFENTSEETLIYKIKENITKTGNDIQTKLIDASQQNGSAYTIPGIAAPKPGEIILSSIEDDYGTSYYFRGNVDNNYLNFAGMCWRIVRVQGNGTIKLILEDQDSTCASSNGNWNIEERYIGSKNSANFGVNLLSNNNGGTSDAIEYFNSTFNFNNSMINIFKKFQDDELSGYFDKLKSGDWCLNDRAYSTSSVDLATAIPLTKTEKENNYLNQINFYYDSEVRLLNNSQKNVTLKCNGEYLDYYSDGTNMYVGALTADEVALAGGTSDWNINHNYYLINDYQKSNALSWWTFSPSRFQIYSYDTKNSHDNVLNVSEKGNFGGLYARNGRALRPAISLKTTTIISGGNGTKTNPYVVS